MGWGGVWRIQHGHAAVSTFGVGVVAWGGRLSRSRDIASHRLETPHTNRYTSLVHTHTHIECAYASLSPAV
jgi:hypothetical protein